jgi:predicted protein tyrosine phosphatase
MKVEVLSRYQMGDVQERKYKYAVISITEPTANFTNYPCSDPNLMGVLAIKFSDITEEIDFIRDEGGRVIMRPISKEQARLVLDFTKSMRQQADAILINCDAGVSRSAAVGAAILRINGEDDSHIWNSPYHYPNKYVYDLLIEESKKNEN